MNNESILFIFAFVIVLLCVYLYLKKRGYYDSFNKKLGFREDEKIIYEISAQYRIKEFLDNQNMENFASSDKELVEVKIFISDKNNLAVKESSKGKRLFFYNSNSKPKIKEIKMGEKEDDIINGCVGEEEQSRLFEFQNSERKYQLYILVEDADKILKWFNK